MVIAPVLPCYGNDTSRGRTLSWVLSKRRVGPVTFTISKNGMAMQNVVVSNSFEMQTLDVGDTYYVYAVVNGITMQTAEFINPESTISASIDAAAVAPGYLVLKVS